MRKLFLIEKNKLIENNKIIAKGRDRAEELTAVQMSQLTPRTKLIYETKDRVAHINIAGTLYKSSNILYSFFNLEQTSYTDIIDVLADLESDSTVDSVQFNVDSHGGSMNFYFETAEAIRNFKKPTKAVIQSAACSAAFGLVAECDSVEAKPWSIIGSVGTILEIQNDKDNENKSDVQVYTFRSKYSPNKNPEAGSEAFNEENQNIVDDFGEMFYKQIASARNQSFDFVVENYGGGSVFLANTAYANKMIDSVDVAKVEIQAEIKNVKGDFNMENIETEEVPTAEKIQAQNTQPEMKNEPVKEVIKEVAADNTVANENVKVDVAAYQQLIKQHPTYAEAIVSAMGNGQSVLELENTILKAIHAQASAVATVEENSKSAMSQVEQNTDVISATKVDDHAAADALIKKMSLKI